MADTYAGAVWAQRSRRDILPSVAPAAARHPLHTSRCPSLPPPPPVYDRGNLFDFVQQLRQPAAAAALAAPQRRKAQRQQLRALVQVFLQVCAALHAMHRQEPALAHRDVKPQNVLLRVGKQAQQAQRVQQAQQQQAAGGPASGGSYDPVPPIAPLGSGSRDKEQQAWAAGECHGGTGSGGGSAADGAPPPPESAAVIAVEQEGEEGRQQRRHRHPQWGSDGGSPPPEWWQQRLGRWQEQYEAVLMDFGSTRTARVEVQSRTQAMAAQEDAEVRCGVLCCAVLCWCLWGCLACCEEAFCLCLSARLRAHTLHTHPGLLPQRQCTAPYRAPELWDVASSCTLGGWEARAARWVRARARTARCSRVRALPCARGAVQMSGWMCGRWAACSTSCSAGSHRLSGGRETA